jgi:hypothetical protein
MLAEGDPALIEEMIAGSKEGFVKLTPAMLNRLQKEDATAYNNAILPHLVANLNGAQFEGYLGAIQTALKNGDNEQAAAYLGAVINWWVGVRDKAKTSGADALAPEREKFNKERETFYKEQTASFTRDLGRDYMSQHVMPTFERLLKPYLTDKDLAPGIGRSIRVAALGILKDALRKDAAYQKQVRAMIEGKNRDRGRILTFMGQKIKDIAPEIIKKIADDFKLTPGKPTKQAGKGKETKTPAVKTSGGYVKVAEKPANFNEICDWEKTSMDDLTYGRATLKSGRKITWR